MKKLTLLTAGAWALGLLVGLYAWLSPDSVLFPGVFLGLALGGAASLLLLVGLFTVGARRSSPREPTAAYFAAIAPLVGGAVALILAARGLLPHPALPLACVIGVGLTKRFWARDLVGAPMGWAAELGVTAVILAALLIIVPALFLSAAGQAIWSIAAPSFQNTIARVNVTNVLAPQRLAPHVGITASAAGLALQAIANTGTTRRESLLIDVPGSSAHPWIPDSGPFSGWPGDSVMRHALAGLTSGERVWLQQLGGHPGIPLIDTVTFAAALDPWAALRTPLPADLNVFSLPIPSVMSIRNAARMQLYRAALAAAERKPALADSLTRSAITFGLRLRDDSDLLITMLIGAAIAREGGLTLAELWRSQGRGRDLDAEQLVHALQYPPRQVDGARTDEGSSAREIRAMLIRGATAGANGRAIRFEHLVVLGLSSCADLRELLYGPAPAVAEAFATGAPLFQRSQKETEVFARMSFGISADRHGVDDVAPVLRPAAVAFGRRPMAACIQAISGTTADY